MITVNGAAPFWDAVTTILCLATREANRVLICDTDSFATILWHRRYKGHHNERLESIASERRADLYLLTGDEIHFVQDGLRDGEHIRHEMHGWFEEALASQSVPWHLLRGSQEQRLAEALKIIRSRWLGVEEGLAPVPGGG